ncbi:unnamed protein product [Rhizoctonia solani]|uniref:MIT domain-containing protein n=1 Tax=Rhizoctonia solani TaxID=456999 RepID=A0A8H3DGQ0_9AGAM|nr:unnamed protein product [Rhizoctonia solani]
MSLKSFCYSFYAILFIVFFRVIGKLFKYKGIFNRFNSRSGPRTSGEKDLERKGRYRDGPPSGYQPGVYTVDRTFEGEAEQAKPGLKKRGKGSPRADKGPKKPSCRRKLDAALPVLLQAVELDNAGSLEAVGAYKEVAILFDDALEILKNEPRKPTQVTVEASLRNMRDIYRDRAELILQDFQERVLKQKFQGILPQSPTVGDTV